MTDKTSFTDEEWHAITDAPLLVTTAIYLAGEHGPISMIKEATASAKAITHPGEHGVANELIGQIVAESNTKETRHEMKEHRGPTLQAAIEGVLHDLAPAAAALQKLPGRRGRPGGRVASLHRHHDRGVREDGEPRRAGDDRQARHALRRPDHLTEPSRR